MTIEPNKLSGKDLASYLEVHRDEFNGNGDAFCLAAGYGIKSDDGTQKCNLTDFIQALSNALDISEDNEDISNT